MITPREQVAAEAAAKAAEGWISSAIPEDDQVKLVVLVVNSADVAANQSVDGRYIAAKLALNAALTEAGYGGRIPDGTIVSVVDAILNAVAAIRAP